MEKNEQNNVKNYADAVSEDDKKKAEEIKEKANSYFKSMWL